MNLWISCANIIIFFFLQILFLSVSGGLLGSFYLLLRKFFGKYIKKKVLYYMWGIILFCFLIPVSLFSFNPLSQTVEQERDGYITGVNSEKLEDTIDPEVSDVNYETQNTIQNETHDKIQNNNVVSESVSTSKFKNKTIYFIMIMIASFIWIMGVFILIIRQYLIHTQLKKGLKNTEILSINIVMLQDDADFVTNIDISKEYVKLIYNITRKESNRLKLKRIPEVLFHNNISTPFLTGIIYQKIYLPEEEVSKTELENVLCHELIHAKRQDLVYSSIVNFIHILHWFNPFVWKMISIIEEDCEFSCDEAVTSAMNMSHRKNYCETILMNIYRAKNKKISGNMSLIKNKNLVERRMGEIMKKQKHKKGLAGIICILLSFTIIVGEYIFASATPKEELSTVKNFVEESMVHTIEAFTNKKPSNINTTNITAMSQSNNKYTNEKSSFSKKFSNIKKIEIHSYNSKVQIKEGTEFLVEAAQLENDYIIKEANGVLTMDAGNKSKNNGTSKNYSNIWYNYNKDASITVYIPKNYKLDYVNLDVSGVMVDGLTTESLLIDSGSDQVSISNVTSKKTVLDSGSGSVSILNSNFGETDIDSGSGKVTMKKGTMKNFELDSGTGAVSIESTIVGDISIDSGSGSVLMTVYGKFSDYNIDTDTGSGDVLINGKKFNNVDDDKDLAKYDLEVDTGSGTVEINYSGSSQASNNKTNTNQSTKNNKSTKKKNYTKKIALNYPTVSKDYQKYLNIAKDKMILKKSYSLNKINELYFNLSHNSVYIYATDAKEMTVIQSYPKKNNNKQYIYNNGKQSINKVAKWDLKKEEMVQQNKPTNNTLILSTKDRNANLKKGEPIIKNPETEIHIFLPKNYKKNLYISTNLGDIVFQHPLEANKVRAYSALGDISIYKNIITKQLKLNSDLGDVIIKGDISSDTLDILGSLGDCDVFNSLYCNKINIDLDLGDCTIKKEINCDEINISLSLGTLKTSEVNANTKILDVNDFDDDDDDYDDYDDDNDDDNDDD